MTEMRSTPVKGWRDARMFCLLTLAAAALHFPHYGLFVGDITRDFYLHYNWAKEFAENFALGNPYPRWMFHGRLGLGEPVFVFYAPVHYFAVAIVALTGLSAWTSLQLVAVAATAAFAGFVYKTCRYYVDARLAAMIGIAAVSSPFLVMLNYKFDGLAWATLGYASHGLLFWALFRPAASRHLVNGWAAVAIGLSIGSHIVSALVNLICYSAAALVPPAGDGRFIVRLGRSLTAWGATVALGVALSGVYLIPALSYLDVIRTDVWDPSVPFTSFAWPLVTQFFFPQRWFSFQWTIALPALALVVVPFAYLLYFRAASKPLARAAAVGAAAVFFASELSFPLWSLNTPLEKVQLPFRFLSVAYTLGAVACGFAIADARAAGRKLWSLGLWALLGCSFLAGALTLLKASYLDGKPLPRELAANEYTFAPFVQRLRESGACPGEGAEDVACLELWGPSGSFRGTPEYRMKWAGPDYAAYAQTGFAGECARKGLMCAPQSRTATGLKWVISAGQPTTVVLPLFHFPSWSMEIDAERVAHSIDPATGLIAVAVPSGTHEVQAKWTLSRPERIGLYSSIGAAIILAAIGLMHRRTRKRSQSAVGTTSEGLVSSDA